MKKEILEWIRDIGIACLLALIILSLFKPIIIQQHSMEPNFYQGDYVITFRQAYRFSGEPAKGDIIVFHSELKDEEGNDKNLIKRIIATGGDTVKIVDGYVYVNGEKIANVAGDKTEYIVTPDKFAAGEQEFAVSAVYASGESKPVAVKLTVVTGIKQIADGNKTFDVYTLDGKLVRQQAKSLEGLKGVYVINGKAVMVK